MKYTKRHLYGQHYLSDVKIISRIIELAEIDSNTRVLEIGTGRGTITRYIALKAQHVLTVELDRKLYLYAKSALRDYSNIQVVQTDILKMNDAGVDVIISSLPYNISRRFIEWLSGQGCARAVVVFQIDFADKLIQKAGTRKYGPSSVLGQFCFNITQEDFVPRTSFEPIPRVSSCIMKFERKVSLLDWKNTAQKLKYLFSFRGKMIRSVLNNQLTLYSGSSLEEYKGDTRRIEEMSPEEFVRLVYSVRLDSHVFT